jgi:hypothetical protein
MACLHVVVAVAAVWVKTKRTSEFVNIDTWAHGLLRDFGPLGPWGTQGHSMTCLIAAILRSPFVKK